jgi:hypothetical protein
MYTLVYSKYTISKLMGTEWRMAKVNQIKQETMVMGAKVSDYKKVVEEMRFIANHFNKQ